MIFLKNVFFIFIIICLGLSVKAQSQNEIYSEINSRNSEVDDELDDLFGDEDGFEEAPVQKKKKRKRRVRKRVKKFKKYRSGQKFHEFSDDPKNWNKPVKSFEYTYEYEWEKFEDGGEFLNLSRRVNLTPGEIAGEVQFEGRAFEQVVNNGETADKAAALFLRAEMPFESKKGDWQAKIKGFGRVDAYDSGRNRIYPEDVWLSFIRDFFQVRVGFQVFNWTQMDIFTPAELLNSVNFDSEVENFEKIGEFALTLKMKLAFGFLEMVYMPFVLAPNFPGGKSRFNILDPGESMGEPLYIKKDGSIVEKVQFNQYALRFSKTIGETDFNFFFVDQVDRRNPEVVFQNSSSSFRPVFFSITSFGANAVRAWDGVLFKVEALRRLVNNPVQPTVFGTLKKKSHSIGAIGAEYEMQISDKSLTIFVEHQKLFGISEGTSSIERQKISVFQNDLAVGLRLAFNDINGRELRLLSDFDFDVSDQILGSLIYSQRLSEEWHLKLGFRYVSAPKQDQLAIGLERFDNDNYGFLQVTRFF